MYEITLEIDNNIMSFSYTITKLINNKRVFIHGDDLSLSDFRSDNWYTFLNYEMQAYDNGDDLMLALFYKDKTDMIAHYSIPDVYKDDDLGDDRKGLLWGEKQ